MKHKKKGRHRLMMTTVKSKLDRQNISGFHLRRTKPFLKLTIFMTSYTTATIECCGFLLRHLSRRNIFLLTYRLSPCRTSKDLRHSLSACTHQTGPKPPSPTCHGPLAILARAFLPSGAMERCFDDSRSQVRNDRSAAILQQ